MYRSETTLAVLFCAHDRGVQLVATACCAIWTFLLYLFGIYG